MSINSAPVSENLQEQDPEMELGSCQSSKNSGTTKLCKN